MPLDSSSLPRVDEDAASAQAAAPRSSSSAFSSPSAVASSPSASIPTTVSVPSVDIALRRLEAAFLLRSEEKAVHAANKLLQPLYALHQQLQPPCPKCCSRSSGAERVAEQPPVLSSLVACVSCGWLPLASSLPAPQFCRALLLHRVSHVTLAKALDSRVKAFQRANNTGAAFRSDTTTHTTRTSHTHTPLT